MFNFCGRHKSKFIDRDHRHSWFWTPTTEEPLIIARITTMKAAFPKLNHFGRTQLALTGYSSQRFACEGYSVLEDILVHSHDDRVASNSSPI